MPECRHTTVAPVAAPPVAWALGVRTIGSGRVCARARARVVLNSSSRARDAAARREYGDGRHDTVDAGPRSPAPKGVPDNVPYVVPAERYKDATKIDAADVDVARDLKSSLVSHLPQRRLAPPRSASAAQRDRGLVGQTLRTEHTAGEGRPHAASRPACVRFLHAGCAGCSVVPWASRTVSSVPDDLLTATSRLPHGSSLSR